MAEQTRTRSVAGLIAVPLCLAVGAVVGCSSNGNANPPAGNGGSSGGGGTSDASQVDSTDAAITCTNDPRAEKFALNMTHKGDNEAGPNLSFVIVGATDNPPAVDNNTWTLKILDASGQPVKDAVLTFPKGQHPSDPWMPDHTHGALAAKAVNNGDGTYTVKPLYFFMGGIWSTYISATSGSVTDTTTFTFCIGS